MRLAAVRSSARDAVPLDDLLSRSGLPDWVRAFRGTRTRPGRSRGGPAQPEFSARPGSPLDDPRVIGEALKGSRLGNFWKDRIGDVRVVAAIEDDALRMLVIKIGHRRDLCRSLVR
jgi:hypothetical protein